MYDQKTCKKEIVINILYDNVYILGRIHIGFTIKELFGLVNKQSGYICKSHFSRIIKKLEKEKLVTVKNSKTDKRNKYVNITLKGVISL